MTDFDNTSTDELYILALDRVIAQSKAMTSFLAITHSVINSGVFDTLNIDDVTKADIITELSVLQEAIKSVVPMIVAHTDKSTLHTHLADAVVALTKRMNQ